MCTFTIDPDNNITALVEVPAGADPATTFASEEEPARRMLWIFAAVVIVLAFVPIRSLSCPGWDVWATDQSGHPVSGMTVRLTYRNYSAA